MPLIGMKRLIHGWRSRLYWANGQFLFFRTGFEIIIDPVAKVVSGDVRHLLWDPAPSAHVMKELGWRDCGRHLTGRPLTAVFIARNRR